MDKFYRAIGEVVRLAAKYLKLRDVRTNEVMEELEMMTQGVGLADEEVQFPIDAVKKTDLEQRLPCMVDRGGMVEALRYVVEIPEDNGYTDISLEIWKKTRKMHVMVREIGLLHALTIRWSIYNIPLNVISVKMGECEEEDCLVVIETGDGVAFLVKQFFFAAFRVFYYEEEEITAGQRLLFMTVLDAEEHQGLTIEDFAQWSGDEVLDQVCKWKAGDKFKRFSAEEAGLVPVNKEEEMEGENLLEEEDQTLTEDPRELEEGGEGNLQIEDENDMGQSPVLPVRGEKSKVEARVKFLNDKQSSNEQVLGSPENLRNIEEEEDDDFIDAIEFGGLNRYGERVVLTTDQMRGVSALLIGGADPSKPQERVDKEAEQFDPIAFLLSVKESDPEARIIKVRKSVHQPWIEEEKKRKREIEEMKRRKMNEGAGDDGNHDSDSDEDEEDLEGREMWSEEEEDVDDDDWETEVMPDVSVSTDTNNGSQLSQGSIWSQSTTNRSPRAELSMNSPVGDENDDDENEEVMNDMKNAENVNEEDDDEHDECRSPAPKRFKMMVQWTSDEEKLALPAASKPTDWSPVLVKTDDGREVVTIGSSSSEEVVGEVADLEEEMRKASMDCEVPEGMRLVSYNTGEIAAIPDNDVVEEVFHELFNGEDGLEKEEDQGEEED